jgi:hypothetical protein
MAEPILASGLAAIQTVPTLWLTIKRRIGSGMTAVDAHELLSQLLDLVDKNLSLAGTLKEPAHVAGGESGNGSDTATGLARAEEQLREIRAEAVRLLKVVDAPVRWPTEGQLREAQEQMQNGERLTAEEFRHALLDRYVDDSEGNAGLLKVLYSDLLPE